MYEAPSAQLHREELGLSPSSFWLRVLVICALGVLAPPTAAFAAKRLVVNHLVFSGLAALATLPLSYWAFAARPHPRRASKSALVFLGVLGAVGLSAFVGLMFATLIGLLYQPYGAMLPSSAGA
ncbi:hypothetical protein [Cognatilysobacter lacus]|uniref:Uncharacterized protein n=1 Tax=Cognatilysobacter lacus TaxID=1643323 RepID=A0A5D8Z043_9GAMM|nr:hypothetical protein [Lysobacter lacus]TZF88345.1 hypothetical protein FW784_10055 [Lysobacter lacus]